jgi:hypothetical protein
MMSIVSLQAGGGLRLNGAVAPRFQGEKQKNRLKPAEPLVSETEAAGVRLLYVLRLAVLAGGMSVLGAQMAEWCGANPNGLVTACSTIIGMITGVWGAHKGLEKDIERIQTKQD